MPSFGTPFSGLANDRKLTDQELIRAIRFTVASEYEANQLYVQLAESTNDKLAIAVLMDIAGEELRHAGQFLRLLYKLAPDEEKLYALGAKEVERAIEKSDRASSGQWMGRSGGMAWPQGDGTQAIVSVHSACGPNGNPTRPGDPLGRGDQ
jgi:rubrerythrin